MSVRRTRAVLLITLCGGMSCLDLTGTPQQHASDLPIVPTRRAMRASVSAVLHVHGWSNHSGSAYPASIAWQSAQAAAAGADVLWWTDHHEYYSHRLPDFVVVPAQATQIGPSLWTVGTWSGGGAQAFLSSTGESFTQIQSEGSQITVSLPPGAANVTDTVTLFFGRLASGVVERAALGVLARPLIGNPEFRMMVWRDSVTRRFPQLEILVPLAWHPRGSTGYRQVLRYAIEGDSLPLIVSGDTAEYTRQWPDSDSATVVLDPKADAAVLPDGLDNTTDEYRISFIASRRATGSTVRFGLPVIANRDSTAGVQMPPAVAIARADGSAYGVRALWGIEVGTIDSALSHSQWAGVAGGGAHMAVYFPGDVSVGFVEQGDQPPLQLTTSVRSMGGITAIAHPLGTSVDPPSATFEQNQPRVDSVGAFLVQHHGWGADLIEVGYINRGGAGLREHLYLLDYLLSSGLPLCGVAATDSHGQRMLSDPTNADERNNLVTWIADVEPLTPATDIIASVRNCAVSFGTPFYVHGGFWIQTLTDSVGEERLIADTSGVSPSSAYYLYEVVVDSSGVGHEPEYYRRGYLFHPSATPTIGGCRPSYVRAEAWAGTSFLASSNVVHVRAVPQRCSVPGSVPR